MIAFGWRECAVLQISALLLLACSAGPESEEETLGSAREALTVQTGEYHEGPDVNDRYIAPITTETWAKIWHPAFSGSQSYPLIVMLHGNHNSCGKNGTSPRIDDRDDYANTGTCPAGYSVVKDHEGYGYLASDLASRGYIVVSINAHRGFPVDSSEPSDDPARLRMRGRLVLWHLKRLSAWSRGLEATPASIGVSLANRIDWGQVGFMGHSRGGPGVRSAIADYRNAPAAGWKAEIPNLIVRSLVEIAPSEVPYGTLPIDDAYGMPLLSMAGLCDYDVSTIQASKQFDRLLTNGTENGIVFKSLYEIYGGNHNYFNSQWQENDASAGCINQTAISAATQRTAALTAISNFFRATVGAGKDPTLAKLFDPVNAAPSGPQLARGYTGSSRYDNSLRLDEFNAPTGINSNWQQDNWHGLDFYTHSTWPAEHDEYFYFADIDWSSSSVNNYFQSNWAAPNSGTDLRSYKYLEFRADQPYYATLTTAIDFDLALANANGTLSNRLAVSSYTTLPPLVATKDKPNGVGQFNHPPMRTVRIPLTAFGGANLASVRGVRFYFDHNSHGSVAIGALRAVKY